MSLFEAIINLTIFDYLRLQWGDAPWVEPVLDIISIVSLSTFCLLIVLFLIWLERKVIARMQDRIGPNRVGGKYGLGQTVADVAKLLTKELITPAGADWVAYNVAPFLIVMTSLLMWAVMPFAPQFIGVDLNIGVFYILSISSVSVVCILLAGWGSNNKYALLGAFRAVAQLVSYEVPMVMSLIVPIILARSMSLVSISEAQFLPYAVVVPMSALVFFISALAETGRTPFDLLEAESEIVAGFHVEYGGMKFGMFFLAEFISTLFMSSLVGTIYFGGYRSIILEWFGVPTPALLGLLLFFVKTFLVYFVFIWIRATWPRLRIDQMLDFNWKFLVPISLVMVLVAALLDRLVADQHVLIWWGAHLGSNLLIGLGALAFARYHASHRKLLEDNEIEGVKAPASAGPLMEGGDHHGHDDHGHGHDDHAHAVPAPAHD